MQVEISDNATVIACATIIATALVVLVLGYAQIYNETSRQAIKAGLVEHQNTGCSGTYWSKP